MQFHLTIDLRAVILGFVLLLVAAGIATPFAISFADDGDGNEVSSAQSIALGSTFTYQGRLDTGSGPANGAYDFEFRLFDSVSGGTQVVTTPMSIATTRPVANGLFTADLDFGTNAFDGNARWLEVRAKATGGPDLPDILAPRQPLNPAPYALFSLKTGPHTHFGESWSGSSGLQGLR